MKLNRLAMIALMALGVVACDKNNNDSDELTAGKKSVVLKLDGLVGTSRAANGTPGAEGKINLANVVIVFSDGSSIIKYEELNSQSGANWTALTTTGVAYHNLDNRITQVHVIGNTTGKTIKLDGTVAEMKASTLDVKDEQDMSNVTLFGEDDYLEPAAGSHGDASHPDDELTMFNAEVNLKPLIARIEIGNIQCEDLGTLYKSLSLQDIGLMNFNGIISLDGVTKGLEMTMANVLEPGTGTRADGEIVFGESVCAGWGWDAISNEVLDGAADIHYPTTGNDRYVYHFIPRNDLKVKLYLSATDVNDHVSPFTTVTAGFDGTTFEVGKIYQLSLVFGEENIKPWDPDETICVNVKVNVAEWDIQQLTPVYE